MLIDHVKITIKAGNGGNGKVSFKRNAQTAKGGPDGGNGGKGGDVYVDGTDDIMALSQFAYKKEVKAEDGVNGGKYNLYGKGGKDLTIFVPLGTRVTDITNNKSFEINKKDTPFLFAKGGKGGLGNNEFKTPTDQAPHWAEKGQRGEVKEVTFELKLIADVGFIGLPNAGKSSLLAALTNANPKIGNYPFTTLEPNLGVLQFDHVPTTRHEPHPTRLVLADIPGLIEGAAHGKGLGTDFLKHVEKTKVLLHCIDSTSQDVLKDYQTVRKEFEEYGKELLGKEEIILLTKIDLVDKIELEKKKKIFTNMKKQVLEISIYNEQSLEELKNIISQKTIE